MNLLLSNFILCIKLPCRVMLLVDHIEDFRKFLTDMLDILPRVKSADDAVSSGGRGEELAA